MPTLLEIGLSNAIAASLLALLAGASRLARRPALAHGLWLLVLLKLITPPFVTYSLTWPNSAGMKDGETAVLESTVSFPNADPMTAAERSPSGWLPTFAEVPIPKASEDLGSQAELFDSTGIALVPRESYDIVSFPGVAIMSRVSWELLLGVLWLVGSVFWFALTACALLRFYPLLRFALPASPAVAGQARRLAKRIGLTASPGISFLPGTLSPMIWAVGGKPRLLLPAELWEALNEEQRATLLVHELAHVRRRDHWVRALELLVTGLFWWHPAVWWARREIRETEEQCCDAWVVWALPNAARAYADALLETVDYLSRTRLALPPAASGIGQIHLLRRRLTMIMHGTTPRALSAAGLLAVLAVGALLLPLGPTLAQTQVPDGTEDLRKAVLAAYQQEATASDVERARAQVDQLEAQIQVQKAQLAAAQASLKKAEAELEAALAGLKQAESRAKRLREARRVYDLQDLVVPIQALPDKRTSRPADRLGELEKKLDELRKELEALRRQSAAGTDKGDADNLYRDTVMRQALKAIRNKPATRSATAEYERTYREYAEALTKLAAASQVRVFQGHGLAVSSVAWSPDGKTAVSGSYDTTLRLWDVSSGKEIRRFIGHDAKVQSVAISPDGRLVLAGGYDGNVILWAVTTGKEVRRFGPQNYTTPAISGRDPNAEAQLQRVPKRVKSVTFSPDGQRVMAGGEDGYLRIWDVRSGKEVVYIGLNSPIQTVAYSPDGKLVAAGCFDGSLNVWNVATARQLSRSEGHTGWILRAAFSPNGQLIASSGEDGTIRLWQVPAGKSVWEMKGHANKVECVVFSQDGKRLASAGFDKTIGIWDVASGRRIMDLKGHQAAVLGVAFSPDGKWLLSGGDDATIRLWSVAP